NRRASIAGSKRRSPVGCPTPASTTSSVTPSAVAIAEAVAAPFSSASSIATVTSAGYALTLAAATPWSAANTTACGSSTAGRSVRCHAASHAATSSSRDSARVAIATCDRTHGDDAGADLVGDDDRRLLSRGARFRGPLGARRDLVVSDTGTLQVRDPQRQAIDDHETAGIPDRLLQKEG